MSAFWHHLRRYDWLLLGAIFILMLLGLLTLFSLRDASAFPYFKRQLLWFAVGMFVLVLASFIDFQFFRTQSWVVFLFYVFSVILLLLLVLAGFSVRGVAAWFRIGNILIQPVEIAKVILIILLAKFFSTRHIEIYRIHHLVVSGLYLLVPTLLVLLQPDLGSAMVLVAIWVSVVVFSGMKLRHFILLCILATLISGIAWVGLLELYQKARITAFVNPYLDPKGAGYQMIQSMIAVGSGRLWGKGLGYGSQTHLLFLPEAETDFIFAAFAEEWGFVGGMVILGLFFVVLWRILFIGMKSADSFSRLYAIGLAALIFFQGFTHVGMNMGVLPITGLTLPFVSYGGSSLVTLMFAIGILQNIKINSRPVREAKDWDSA